MYQLIESLELYQILAISQFVNLNRVVIAILLVSLLNGSVWEVMLI